MKLPSPALPPNLQNLLVQNNPDLDYALGQQSIRRAELFLQGIRYYQNHTAQRSVQLAPVIWQEGTTKLRDYNPSSSAPIILVVPSLINRFDVMDLDANHSFLRSLATAGFRPMVVDWNAPGEVENQFGFDDYVQRLLRIVEWSKKYHTNIHLLGYCMGGLLALALATLKREAFKTLLLMATPWNFHQPNDVTGVMLGQFAADWQESFRIAGQMPVDMIQYLFALLQPFYPVGKFIEFAEMDQTSAEARHFVLLEDWLNDGVPLPVKVAEECLKGWYGENRPALLQWKIGGQIVDPSKLAMPSYVVVPGRDHIVPPESALPLATLLPNATLHEPPTGHIGMMASRNAAPQVWEPLIGWINEYR